MRNTACFTFLVLIAGLMLSCATPATVAPTATVPQATATVEQVVEATAAVGATVEPVPFLLSEPGPYYTGKRTYTFEDASRDGREVGITVVYPALLPEGSQGSKLLAGANRDPDLGDAPYPLILTGPNSGDELFKAHLATHGFVMVIVRFPDYYDYPDFQVVDHPRDLLFVLDQIASQPLEGLEGVIDSDQVGVAGYSGDGFISLALSGVRIDPGFYLSFCEQAPTRQPPLSEWYVEFWCGLAKKWDEFAIHAGEEITASDDGLWQALTDERIRVVVPMAADGAQLYGERGLAMADRPMLMLAPTEDEWVPYQIETATIFEHVGSSERFLVSFIGRTHMMVFNPEVAKRLNHFSTAFFGYHLQGKSEYRDHFSEAFVSQFDDLAWGLYEEPPEAAGMPPSEWHLVVIGDSSLWGLGKAFASQMKDDVGVEVVLNDFALPNLSAGAVLKALQAEEPASGQLARLPVALRDAEVVVMFANPLDSVDPENPLDLEGCFGSSAPDSCDPETFERYTADMKAIWAEILELRGGKPTILRATDIYNPLVSPWNDGGVFEACTECWENMSHAARLAAEAHDIPFLSRYEAFNGIDHNEDPREKGYIRSDGEHPSDLASQYTAELLSQMGYEPVSPP